MQSGILPRGLYKNKPQLFAQFFSSGRSCVFVSFLCVYLVFVSFHSQQISLEGMMLKPKLQYFDHLMGRVDSLEKTLMLGGIVGRRTRG